MMCNIFLITLWQYMYQWSERWCWGWLTKSLTALLVGGTVSRIGYEFEHDDEDDEPDDDRIVIKKKKRNQAKIFSRPSCQSSSQSSDILQPSPLWKQLWRLFRQYCLTSVIRVGTLENKMFSFFDILPLYDFAVTTLCHIWKPITSRFPPKTFSTVHMCYLGKPHWTKLSVFFSNIVQRGWGGGVKHM